MHKAIAATAATLALLLAPTPASADWRDNPNMGAITICDRAGHCTETPVKFNCQRKNKTPKQWASLCGTR